MLSESFLWVAASLRTSIDKHKQALIWTSSTLFGCHFVAICFQPINLRIYVQVADAAPVKEEKKLLVRNISDLPVMLTLVFPVLSTYMRSNETMFIHTSHIQLSCPTHSTPKWCKRLRYFEA